MKRILLTLCAILVLTAAYAQSGPRKSTVHLKSGETYTGVITERNDQLVTLQTELNGTMTFTADEINFITHEARKKNYDTAKFRGFIDLGYSLGVGEPRNDFWLIETSFGYQLTPRAYLGAGLGIHNFDAKVNTYPMRTDKETLQPNDPDWRYPFIPVYLEGRYSFKNESMNTPFVSLKVGATFINHPGFYTSPSVGYHFKAKDIFSFNVSLGYALHTAHYKLWCLGSEPGARPDDSGSSYIHKGAAFHNLLLKVGVEF